MLQVKEPTLLDKIIAREAVVGICGLGYVGLPLALTFGEKGFPVVGFDIDQRKIDAIEKGETYIKHIAGERIRKATGAEKPFTATMDFRKASQADALILCVPTPLNGNREPDMTYIENTARAIGPYVRPGQLVVLESSTYPGTTDEVVKPILEKLSGLRAGIDFFLAFSPEREDPGNPKFNTATIPKVVGGYTKQCTDLACALYASAISKVVPVKGTREAELTKLLENIFRCVNIALVNEMKLLCERMKIDIWEVIDAAATKPFGFMPFYPGPGLGGHCIPIDPFYLTWKAREFEFQTRFIELAGEINWQMPYHVVERTMDALNEQGKALKGARVLILGLAYKKNIDDLRESPSIRLIELFKQKGAEVQYHDPYCPKMKEMRHQPRYMLEMESVPLDPNVAEADVVVIATDHDCIDYQQLVHDAKLVVDARNATRNVTFGRDKIRSA
ncbi:MAG: nucleotide sugar dehydrogenase [Deltaproteobacteria bacterium]|nr:MAG: nucleotide sugar dehydrogenase [Deltaproteobacteria bacterium]